MTVEEFIKMNPKSLNFLKGHPDIMRKIYERVVERWDFNEELAEIRLKEYKISNGGSFNWMDTPEGITFWGDLFVHKNIDAFYKLYPKTNKNKID